MQDLDHVSMGFSQNVVSLAPSVSLLSSAFIGSAFVPDNFARDKDKKEKHTKGKRTWWYNAVPDD